MERDEGRGRGWVVLGGPVEREERKGRLILGRGRARKRKELGGT